MACIEWTGFVNPKTGYGQRTVDQTTWLAHRYAYCVHHGLGRADIAGVVIRHTCDNKVCINPKHLIPGTQQDNVRDCMDRGRNVKGETHGRAKLTEQQVRELRTPGAEVKVLAAEFGINISTAYKVRRGVAWAGV